MGALPDSWPTGADVRQAVEYRLPDGTGAVLAVAGSALHALAWDGRTLFHSADRTITRVLHVAETGDGPIALVVRREDRIDLIDLQTGRTGWHFVGPEGTRLSGPGSSKLVVDDGVLCWLIAPAYAEFISCYEISSVDAVRTRWTHDFAGRYDRGFGPAMIVTDALQSGRPQVVLSSRTGSAYTEYGEQESAVPTEQVVLGRADGHLYQAILDLGDGRIVQEVAYRPDDGDYPCARPYGLLQSVAAGDERLLVLVSCQVEEYYSVTRVGKNLERAWGEFVEKDWPVDDQELRPQVTSVVERAGRDPLLVIGHFDSTGWRTVVRSAASGEVIAQLADHYFWGTVPSPAGPLAVVSPASTRQLHGDEGLATFTVDGLEPVSAAAGLRPLTCATDILPPQLTFHADRHSLVPLTRNGDVGVLASVAGRLVWWDPYRGRAVRVADIVATAAYPALDGAAIVVAADALHRMTPESAMAATVRPQGRRPDLLAIVVDEQSWVLGSLGTGISELRTGDVRFELDGRAAAITAVSGGVVLATIAADRTALIWRATGAQPTQVLAIAPPGTPTHVRFIGDDRVLVTEQTGVHTAAAAVYDAQGNLVWRDAARGPHPNLPLVTADSTGRRLVAYDDHGVLTIRAADTGQLLAERDWTAAYTTPMLISDGGADVLLRVGGVHGMECLDIVHGPDGQMMLQERWRLTATLWRYFPGDAAVARTDAGWRIGALSPAGELDIVDLADGRIQHSVAIGPVAARPPIGIIDDGAFVTGTADGRVLLVDALDADVREHPVRLGAAVESLVLTGDTEILVGTADGIAHRVRL